VSACRATLGDQQAMAYVRIGGVPMAAMADTGTQRSIMAVEIARVGRAAPTGRRGTMYIAGHRLRGAIMRVRITVPRTTCAATVAAFVPDKGQPFRKGLILGMDFLQAARMHINAETGEAYCPAARAPKKS
jgi:hypothetical protein